MTPQQVPRVCPKTGTRIAQEVQCSGSLAPILNAMPGFMPP